MAPVKTELHEKDINST